MSDITTFTEIPLKQLLANVQYYRYNPSRIQGTVLDHLEKVLAGTVDIVDPTNPFVFLLEASSVNTAASIIESEMNVRMAYPSLAQTEDHLYSHMSDKDYIGRFATPAKTKFSFAIMYKDMLAKMVDSPAEKCKKVTILGDSRFTVNDVTFMMQYPVHIRQFYNSVVQVSQDASKVSPLLNLETNMIEPEIRKDSNGVDWFYFEVDVIQATVETFYYAVMAGTYFTESMAFFDQYCYARVWHKGNNVNSVWTEILTTHSGQVFDPLTPTALLKVVGQELTVAIPAIYVNRGDITGSVRVDVYTTKGRIMMNMNNFTVVSFSHVLATIDEETNVNDYSNAMNDVSLLAYSNKTVSGGTNGVSFEAMRQQVIYNVIGHNTLPITNVQLQFYAQQYGFELIKNVDNITNRIFTAVKDLPKPSSEKLITPANLTSNTLIVNLQNLAELPEVSTNGDRVTLHSDTLYVDNNGQLSIYAKPRVDALLSLSSSTLCEVVGQQKFLYSPFYYVLDNSRNEFEVRAYHLDAPVTDVFSFIDQNPTSVVKANTVSYVIEKVSTGYTLTIICRGNLLLSEMDDRYVHVQLGFTPPGENTMAFINGRLLGKAKEAFSRAYVFDIMSNHDIDSDNLLTLTNFKMYNTDPIKTKTPLTNQFHIYYSISTTPNDFVAGDMDKEIGKFLLPKHAIAVTHERITLTLGYSLKNLWTRSRSVASGMEYGRYVADVVMTYADDVYERDLTSGSIFTFDDNGDPVSNLLHRKGDVVYDDSGNVVYSHRKGDVVLNSAGQPESVTEPYTKRFLDMLFVDGTYFFANDSLYKQYRREVTGILNSWITDTLGNLTDVLLEQTKVYYYPRRTIGQLDVMLQTGVQASVEAAQSFTVDLYVYGDVFRNNATRAMLKYNTVTYLDQAVRADTVSISQIIYNLKTLYGDSVVSVKVSGLGGEKDYEVLTVLSKNNRLSLKKRLITKEDGSLAVEEDVTINFLNYSAS